MPDDLVFRVCALDPSEIDELTVNAFVLNKKFVQIL